MSAFTRVFDALWPGGFTLNCEYRRPARCARHPAPQGGEG